MLQFNPNKLKYAEHNVLPHKNFMQDYFKETEYILNQVKFRYLGQTFTGRGIMSWKPEGGFHIEAPLDLEPLADVREVPLGRLRVVSRKDAASIKLIFPGTERAIASAISLIDRYDVLSEKRLSININRVLFFTQDLLSEEECSNDQFRGSALFEIEAIDFLSDLIELQENVILGDRVVPLKSERNWRGILHEGQNGELIVGYCIDKQYLKVDWELPRKRFNRAYAWRLPESIQYALSIFLGQDVCLLQREMRWDSCQRIEMRKKRKITLLGFLQPIQYRSTIDREHFIRLIHFVSAKEPGSEVCCRIFKQLLNASSQFNWQIREFIVSSILEAALRSINQEPFLRNRGSCKKWNVGIGLHSFLNSYLPESWEPLHERVMKDFSHLRDRSAHPDWLFTQGGALSEEEREKSLDSMIFLSRFYGYMILALVGFRDLEPIFPTPHTEWRTPLTFVPATLPRES
jgi:hypothetical protein